MHAPPPVPKLGGSDNSARARSLSVYRSCRHTRLGDSGRGFGGVVKQSLRSPFISPNCEAIGPIHAAANWENTLRRTDGAECSMHRSHSARGLRSCSSDGGAPALSPRPFRRTPSRERSLILGPHGACVGHNIVPLSRPLSARSRGMRGRGDRPTDVQPQDWIRSGGAGDAHFSHDFLARSAANGCHYAEGPTARNGCGPSGPKGCSSSDTAELAHARSSGAHAAGRRWSREACALASEAHPVNGNGLLGPHAHHAAADQRVARGREACALANDLHPATGNGLLGPHAHHAAADHWCARGAGSRECSRASAGGQRSRNGHGQRSRNGHVQAMGDELYPDSKSEYRDLHSQSWSTTAASTDHRTIRDAWKPELGSYTPSYTWHTPTKLHSLDIATGPEAAWRATPAPSMCPSSTLGSAQSKREYLHRPDPAQAAQPTSGERCISPPRRPPTWEMRHMHAQPRGTMRADDVWLTPRKPGAEAPLGDWELLPMWARRGFLCEEDWLRSLCSHAN